MEFSRKVYLMIESNRPVAAVITYLSTVVPILDILVWVLPKPHIKDLFVSVVNQDT